MNTRQPLRFWRTILAFTAGLVAAGTIQMVLIARSYAIQVLHSNWLFLLLAIGIFLAAVLAVLVATFTHRGPALPERSDSFLRRSTGWKVVAGVTIVVLPLLLAVGVLHPYVGKYYLTGYLTRVGLFWCIAMVGMFCARTIHKDGSWLASLGLSALIMGIVYRTAVTFSTVSAYPFARGWSEISRIYGASLFFSQRLYGIKVPLSVLHPAWHLLLALPFLFGNLPIWTYRLWQVVLQIGLTSVLSLWVVKRLGLRSKTWALLIGGWAFLFLMQAFILVHLMVCASIVILAVKPGRFWRTTMIVLVASVWAGWCRINWFPVPALLTGVLYLLEIPFRESKRWLQYLWKPAFWFVVGTLAAYASNVGYMAWSGNGGGGNFTSSLHSDLLWYRLLPNLTYPHGVLPDMLIVSIPLLLVAAFLLRRGKGSFHPLRLGGILAILLVFCLGGLLVSAKIGGGADLHNLDAYFIVLLLMTTYLFSGAFIPEQGENRPDSSGVRSIPLSLIILGVLVPIGFGLQFGRPVFTWDHSQAEQALSSIKSKTEAISSQGGEVLFISQRQLLVQKIVDVPLVPEYEQDYLMEMVMSHNAAYLEQFQADLKRQRFALIIADTQNVHYYGRTSPFGEENDLWVREVSVPLLCYYQPSVPTNNLGVVMYLPRQTPCENH